MLRTDSDPELRVFDPAIRFLHWLTLFLVTAIFILAFSIDFASSKNEAVALIQLHRSFGVTVWIVTLGRLVWRQYAHFPNWPDDMPQAMRFAAQWSEYALYALLLTQPILGLLWTNAYGDRVNLFLVGEMPALIGPDRPLAKQLGEAHTTVGFLFLGLIALHASAALYHHFWRRDDTLKAMLPQRMSQRNMHGRTPEAEVVGSARPLANGLSGIAQRPRPAVGKVAQRNTRASGINGAEHRSGPAQPPRHSGE